MGGKKPFAGDMNAHAKGINFKSDKAKVAHSVLQNAQKALWKLFEGFD